jgi:hypothetical protein
VRGRWVKGWGKDVFLEFPDKLEIEVRVEVRMMKMRMGKR